MLRDTAKHQFEAVIVWKIDRFGRNREEIAFNKYRCKKNGVKVLYIAESIPDTPEGIILESVLEGMAEYYSVQLATNVKRGMVNVASKGQTVGGRIPLGYRVKADKHFELDPRTAPVVRRIFEMYAAGQTRKDIVDSLNAEGFRTHMGNPLTVNSLSTILKNKKYIGIYHYDGKEYPDAYIPAIVDEETFAKVQEMLVKNRRAPTRKWSKDEYLLTGKLYCGLCGTTMVGESGTGKNGEKYHYYNCLQRKRHHTCHKKAIRKREIEDRVLKAAMAVVMSDEMVEFITDQVYDAYVQRDSNTSYKDSLRKQLKQVETAQGNLVRALEAGIFSEATKRRMDELEEQRQDLEAALADAELISGLKLTKENIRSFLVQFRSLNIDEPESQRRIIDIFVNSVFVYDDKLTVTFNYSGDHRTITLPETLSAETDVRTLCGMACQENLGSTCFRGFCYFVTQEHCKGHVILFCFLTFAALSDNL